MLHPIVTTEYVKYTYEARRKYIENLPHNEDPLDILENERVEQVRLGVVASSDMTRARAVRPAPGRTGTAGAL